MLENKHAWKTIIKSTNVDLPTSSLVGEDIAQKIYICFIYVCTYITYIFIIIITKFWTKKTIKIILAVHVSNISMDTSFR